MNILVIGLGSMGKRRIRLLKNNFEIESIIGVDSREDRREYCRHEYGISTYSSISEATASLKLDVAFVCTAPLSHADIIYECLKCKMHVFSEINLVDDRYDENMKLSVEEGVKLFMSSTPIYRDEMKYIYSAIGNAPEKLCYSYHVGQYLPDWHPWENYKDFFVGNKRTNGCREILAIELPWICRVFGKITNVKVIRQKLLSLELDYNDCYVISLQHENGNIGSIIVDVVAREPIRDLKIIGENTYITWMGEADTLSVRNSSGKVEAVNLYNTVEQVEGYNKTIVENEYVNEMKQFFDELAEKVCPVYTFEDDKKILSIIDMIEQD